MHAAGEQTPECNSTYCRHVEEKIEEEMKSDMNLVEMQGIKATKDKAMAETNWEDSYMT